MSLVKNKGWVYKRVISRANFYEVAPGGPFRGEAGYMDKADLSITAAERTTELVDGSNFQLGYEVSFSITSIQLYNMHEFDKLKNMNAYVEFPEIPMWINGFNLNISMDLKPGETLGKVMIKGKRFVEKLSQAIASDFNGNVFLPFDPGTGILPVADNFKIPGGDNWEYAYVYTMDLKDPLQEIITPAAPTATDPLTEFKLTVVLPIYQLAVDVVPSAILLSYFNGTAYVPLGVGDYEIIYEGGGYGDQFPELGGTLYKIHFDFLGSGTCPVLLGTKVLLNYNLTPAESSV